MALVMLPCDLPWWSTIQKRLIQLQESKTTDEIIEIMQRIHDLCNVSLDPDEDERDPTIFNGLKDILATDFRVSDKSVPVIQTIKIIAQRAISLKQHRPPRGLEFSLQQQSDSKELTYDFVAALLANAFFSTFPKRTKKTHPTLQDFNFTYFFKDLHLNSQKAKLRSFLHYFNTIESNLNWQNGSIRISRKVMTGKQWLTIEDWLECTLPLCPLDIKHEWRIERTIENFVQTVFATSRLGGHILSDGNSQESIHFSSAPEIIAILLYVESVEDNEAIFVENARQFTRIIGPDSKSILEILEKPKEVSLVLMDAENYTQYPVNQFEEDNVLRELNKCLLGFRQNTPCSSLDTNNSNSTSSNANNNNNNTSERRPMKSCNSIQRRLSPIGESGRNSPKDITTTIVIRQASNSTKRSSYDSERLGNDIEKRRSWLVPAENSNGNSRTSSTVVGPTASGRRGKFIVLGSSGECLPVSRGILHQSDSNSLYSSCDSDSEDFHSAHASLDIDNDKVDDQALANKFANELDTPAKRYTFAEKLRAALRQSDNNNFSQSTDNSYAVDISISGSIGGDEGIRIRRGGSTGFVLKDDSLDDDLFFDSIVDNDKWMKNGQENGTGSTKNREANNNNNSSNYSFSTEYSSELEEVYEQFSRWIDDPIIKENVNKIDSRDEAVLNFANSLLKRTLSESFVGVPLTDGCISSTGTPAEENSMQNYQEKKQARQIHLFTRSLSLELAKQKHRLAAQLTTDTDTIKSIDSQQSCRQRIFWSIVPVETLQIINCDDVNVKISQIGANLMGKNGVRPVATGNWGCGKTLNGDVQLKMVIQWMAASVAGLPILMYYTAGNEKLTKLDTVCRVLLDRKWTVGELASATLLHARDILTSDSSAIDSIRMDQCIFEKLIGI